MNESDQQSREGGKESLLLDVYSRRWRPITGDSPNVRGSSGCWVAKTNDRCSLHSHSISWRRCRETRRLGGAVDGTADVESVLVLAPTQQHVFLEKLQDKTQDKM